MPTKKSVSMKYLRCVVPVGNMGMQYWPCKQYSMFMVMGFDCVLLKQQTMDE